MPKKLASPRAYSFLTNLKGEQVKREVVSVNATYRSLLDNRNKVTGKEAETRAQKEKLEVRAAAVDFR